MTIDPSLADPTSEPAQTPRPPLTLEQTAWVLDVSPRTVRRLIATRKLRKLPLTRAVRIGLEDLERFLRGEVPATDGNGDIAQYQ